MGSAIRDDLTDEEGKTLKRGAAGDSEGTHQRIGDVRRDFLATQHLNVLPLRRRDGVLCVPVHNGNYHIAVMNPHGHLLSHMALRMTVCRHPHADNDAPCMACDSTVIAVCRSTRHALQRVRGLLALRAVE